MYIIYQARCGYGERYMDVYNISIECENADRYIEFA